MNLSLILGMINMGVRITLGVLAISCNARTETVAQKNQKLKVSFGNKQMLTVLQCHPGLPPRPQEPLPLNCVLFAAMRVWRQAGRPSGWVEAGLEK